MDIKPIRTEANYRAALKAIESLMAAKANTPEGDRSSTYLHGGQLIALRLEGRSLASCRTRFR